MTINQLKAGASLSYISIILTSVIGILITPYMIKKLGTSEYGLYTLIGAFIGYLTLLDFGLNNTIIRFTAKYRAKKDKEGEAVFLGTSFIIYSIISLIIVIIGVVLYFNIENIFGNSLTLKELNKAKTMSLILIFNVAITLPGGIFFGISTGYEKFIFPRASRIIKYLIRSILLVSILFYEADSIGIVILDTIMNILLIIANAYYVLNVIKINVKFKGINKELLKEIFSYSFWIFLIALTHLFQWRSGQLALGITINTSVVAIYGIGVMLGGFFGAFGAAISGVFLPKATHMVVSNNSPTKLTNMMIRIGRISLIVLLYILGAFILYGQEFIILWLGNDYIDSWFVALMIMLIMTFSFSQSFGNSILEARKMIRFRALFFLTSLIIGTFTGALLSIRFSIKGMIAGIIIAMFINQIGINIYYKHKIHLEITRFFKETFSKFILPFILSLMVGHLTNHLVEISWVGFLIKSILYTLFYSIFIILLGMNHYEKQLFSNYIKSIYYITQKK